MSADVHFYKLLFHDTQLKQKHLASLFGDTPQKLNCTEHLPALRFSMHHAKCASKQSEFITQPCPAIS